MNSRVLFAIHCIIGITALAVLGYALSQPLANLSISKDNIKVSSDIYITQECLSVSAPGMASESQCSDLSPVFKPQMQAIMGIAITLMICIILQCIGFSYRESISNILGLLVLGLSITLIILVAILSNFNKSLTPLYGGTTYYYTLTNTSIGILVIASLLILLELCCNKLIHRAVLTPYRMITNASKKV